MAWKPKLGRNVLLAHGAGGRETGELLQHVLLSRLTEEMMKLRGGYGTDVLDDGATIPLPDGQHLVVSIDSYTVNPIFFPGGDIGKLAATGSINDVAMMGAKPLAVMDSIVVEEGFPMEDLERIVGSMVEVLRNEGVALIGGDLKVMPQGQLDRIVITTAALGVAEKPIVDVGLRPGDKIVVSGPVGEHGATIMALQHGIGAEAEGLRSDCRTLTSLMLPLVERFREHIHAAQDPTRGGLAMALNDWASKSGTVIVVEEQRIPLREPVRAYSEMLGIDPLSLASEGVALLGVAPEAAEEVLDYIRSLGFRDAEIIGEVRRGKKHRGVVLLRTRTGGLRILEPPSGELVPRIC